jgi:hypothetical protein
MNSLVALKRLVYIMIAIVAIEYRNKTLIERQIENPVKEENFVSQKANCRIHVLFLAIPRG